MDTDTLKALGGLGLFLVGLEQTLFPLGRLMAQQLTDPTFLESVRLTAAGALQWSDFYWVYLFAAAIGFSTTMAEPALMAVAIKASAIPGATSASVACLALPREWNEFMMPHTVPNKPI